MHEAQSNGDSYVDGVSGAAAPFIPKEGYYWSEGAPKVYYTGKSALVVSAKTGQYVDIFDKGLKKQFDNVYRGDDPLNRYADPVGNASFSVRILCGLASMVCPVSNNAPYLIYPNPVGVLNDSSNAADNYINGLITKRINYYSEYNIIY